MKNLFYFFFFIIHLTWPHPDSTEGAGGYLCFSLSSSCERIFFLLALFRLFEDASNYSRRTSTLSVGKPTVCRQIETKSLRAPQSSAFLRRRSFKRVGGGVLSLQQELPRRPFKQVQVGPPPRKGRSCCFDQR